MKSKILMLVVVAAMSWPISASADPVLVSGSGSFGANALTTDYSAPSETWSFSFVLPDPIAANPTTEATDFSYFLNGSEVSILLGSVEFYTAAEGGLFQLNFDNVNFVGYYGADVGSTLSLVLGTFNACVGIQSTNFSCPEDGSGSVTLARVPEPISISLFGSGLLAVGALRRRRRKVV